MSKKISDIIRPNLDEDNLLVRTLLDINGDWKDIFEKYRFRTGAELIYLGGRPAHVYFPSEGLVSLLINPFETTDVEDESQVAMVTDEDCAGIQAVLGSSVSPYRAVVDVGGQGWRCSAQAARQLLANDPVSRDVMLRYADLQLTESWHALATAQCVSVRTRVALWLLRTARSLGTTVLAVTNASASLRTGIRRPTVTLTLQAFSAEGLIETQRGRVDLKDIPGLVKAAGDAWPVMTQRRQTILDQIAAIKA